MRRKNKVSTSGINPDHYKKHPSGVEAIQITEHFNFNLGNVIKYVWRAGLKHEEDILNDLRKAEWYIKRELARLQNLYKLPTEQADMVEQEISY
jgi:hypothetical protein